MADRRLQIFHAVAREASFTRAAETLFMSQPAVTTQIRLLEAQYQTRLFERRREGATLTPAGELLYSYAVRLLALSDELDARMAECTGTSHGTLAIGASQTLAEFVLPDLLLAFNENHPQVRLCLHTGTSAELESQLAGNTLDLALLEGEPRVTGLSAERVADDELRVVCAPDHPLAQMRRVSARALADYEYIAREAGSATRDATDAYFRAHRIDPASLKVQAEVGSPAALKRIVERGLGFAVVSRLAIDHEITNGTLVDIPLRPALQVGLYLAIPEDRFRSRLLGAFADFARRRLKEMLA